MTKYTFTIRNTAGAKFCACGKNAKIAVREAAIFAGVLEIDKKSSIYPRDIKNTGRVFVVNDYIFYLSKIGE